MPGTTHTVPAWMTSGVTKDIPLNGISNGLKAKNVGLPKVPGAQNDGFEQDGILPAPTAFDHTFSQERLQTEKTQARKDYEKEKKEFTDAWTEAGNHVGLVFEELFRERLSVGKGDIDILIQRLDINDYNVAVRSWNASIPDRKSLLRPLRALDGTNNNNVKTIEGLQVTIEELEALPDVVKAGLLMALNFEETLITFPDLFDEKGALVKEYVDEIKMLGIRAGIYKKPDDRRDSENEVFDELQKSQAKNAKTGKDQLEARLTKQLRVAVGLPAVSVG